MARICQINCNSTARNTRVIFFLRMAFTSQLQRKAGAIKALAQHGGYGVQTDTASPFTLLIDFDYYRKTLKDCKGAFPKHWKHCFAVKANPTRLVLAEAVKNGFGMEAASIGELRMAGRAQAPPSHIVYDSPLKSERDIAEALSLGVLLNIDNFEELDCVASWIEKNGAKGPVGVRVNPQVGSGSLAGFSTGTLTSKFGVGLRDEQGAPIREAYKKYPWLSAIMCHVGSQGIPFDLAIQGIRDTVDFALSINKELGHNQIQIVDIGGGLSVNFASDEVTPTFQEYADALKAKVPELFDPSTFSEVYTEFGRALIVKAGFFASRVEYSKITGGRRIAIQYAGADTCVRTIYHPKEWPLRVSILDGEFGPRGGEGVSDAFAAALPGGIAETDIAGPCCIQADIVAHQRLLPPIRRGDTVLLHDVGGYYHSGHTRYNLRQAPSVWSFEDAEGVDEFKFTLLQPAETVDQTLDAFCEEGYNADVKQ